MRRIRLTLRGPLEAPLSGEPLAPDRLGDRPEGEIAAVGLRYGNRDVEIGDLFRVEVDEDGDPAADGGAGDVDDDGGGADDGPARLILDGDLGACERLGAGMEGSTLVVEGDVGDHAGAGMAGGSLLVRGSAGDFCGAEMTGGVIRVQGDVGARAGAAYPGSRHGMNRGLILVEGDAGPRLGESLRRGLIAVRGRTGRLAGAHMVAGSLFLLGGCDGPPGAAMRRGTILATGEPGLLPGFRYACTYRPPFLPFYWRQLASRHEFPVADDLRETAWRRYSGDFTELGRGEVLLPADEHSGS